MIELFKDNKKQYLIEIVRPAFWIGEIRIVHIIVVIAELRIVIVMVMINGDDGDYGDYDCCG